MNDKEIAELRRRYRSDRTNISRIFGCFVNEKKEIISEFDQSIGTMSEDDLDGMLLVLKKVFSGAQGRNLHEIEFSTAQVTESDDYKLILGLRDTKLESAEQRSELYEKIVSNLELDGNYMILLAHDSYDVFDYNANGEREQDSTTVFSYIVCAICPIKAAKQTMSYYMPGKCFRSVGTDTLISRPELGFIFPAFDERRANIYKALYYTKSVEDNRDALAGALFGAELPMPAAEQKETFSQILEQSVADECSLRVVRSVHAQLEHKVEEHKNEKIEEPCVIDKTEAGDMLRYCGVDEEKVEAFEQKFDECFGENATVPVANIKSRKKLEVKTPEITVKADSGCGDMVEARIIDGVKYILIRADDGAVVNGVKVTF